MTKESNFRSRPATKPLRAMALCCMLAVAPITQAAAGGAQQVTAWVTSTTAQTKHPIVLVHGLMGFDNVLGVDYFYKVPQSLAGAGAKVYVAQVSALNTSEVRGEQLIRELKNIRALTGNPTLKFNLIGHSQGSPTSRYVAAVAPDLVASVTSVGGANGGSKVADMLARLPNGGFAQTAIASATKFLAQVIGALSGKDPDQLPEAPLSSLYTLSTPGSNAFNAKFPQGLRPAGSSCAVTSGPAVVNGIRYYSWTGIAPTTNLLDISDAPMGALGALAYPGVANDGLVGACDSRLGQHLGDYRQNHLDEINQVFGLTDASLWSLFEKKPIQLYLDQAARLKGVGL
ncbi:triacylglycerol lipase [Variovorax sp. J22R133]|uniref:esterase/lipase family protein n=1 Tax=Variovorax brevis TaxID=3053503 RepID=UPI002577475B|nr:triacylglycerol lipase [Variovorax sp. J22R133]MDM0111592.1 triacylglycerol lipase [Variovorax sp. J22R133]